MDEWTRDQLIRNLREEARRERRLRRLDVKTERQRRRQAEAECERLRTVIVEITVRFYAGDTDRLPGLLGGSDRQLLFGALQSPVDGEDDNEHRG